MPLGALSMSKYIVEKWDRKRSRVGRMLWREAEHRCEGSEEQVGMSGLH